MLIAEVVHNPGDVDTDTLTTPADHLGLTQLQQTNVHESVGVVGGEVVRTGVISQTHTAALGSRGGADAGHWETSEPLNYLLSVLHLQVIRDSLEVRVKVAHVALIRLKVSGGDDIETVEEQRTVDVDVVTKFFSQP